MLSPWHCDLTKSCILLWILRALGYYDFLEVNPHQKEKTIILIFGHFLKKRKKKTKDNKEDAYSWIIYKQLPNWELNIIL